MDQDRLKALEVKFHQAMLGIYGAALREAKYKATRFKQMVVEKGGLATAQHLLDSKPENVSEGFTELALRQRLDLTVESLVLDEQWRPLFTAEQIRVAQARLQPHSKRS